MLIVGLSAVLGVLVSPSMAEPPEDREIACIYRRTAAEDALVLYAMGRRAEPQDARENEATDRFADQAGWCREHHRWAEGQTLGAIQYALGRAAYEDSTRQLSGRGFAPGFLELIIADLGEEGLAMLRSGDDRPENLDFVGKVLSGRLEDSGAFIADREDLVRVGRIVARGIMAASTREMGIAAFHGR